jgi:hypothetical protein
MSDIDAINRVFAEYVRATDRRDGTTQSLLFTEDTTVQAYINRNGRFEQFGEPMRGRASVVNAVDNLMSKHGQGDWSHHTTSNEIIDVAGDTATYDAQFIVFAVRRSDPPPEGFPTGTVNRLGGISPIESGYYRSRLVKVAGGWKIAYHDVILDIEPVYT